MKALRVLILATLVTGHAGALAFAAHAGGAMDMSHDAGMQQQAFTQHYDNSLFRVTENGLYSVELVIKDGTLFVGSNTMDIIVHDQNDKDVTGAKITITPWMPDMGHGVPKSPKIIERGGGRYTAEMVNASMPGIWELRITVNAGSGLDSAVFSFPNVLMREGAEMEGMGHEHDMQDMSHEGIEMETQDKYSHTVKSEKDLFTISYNAQYEDIPIRKIHQWRLDIADKDGNPVDGADIKVSGLMPTHGHGLPTQPEVMPEGGGLYLIDGMSFSMPGHWTVTVNIIKDGVEDSATFNLDLKR